MCPSFPSILGNDTTAYLPVSENSLPHSTLNESQFCKSLSSLSLYLYFHFYVYCFSLSLSTFLPALLNHTTDLGLRECWLGLPSCVKSSGSSLSETQFPQLQSRPSVHKEFFWQASAEAKYQAAFVSCGGLYKSLLLHSLNSSTFLEVHLPYLLFAFTQCTLPVWSGESNSIWGCKGVRIFCWFR